MDNIEIKHIHAQVSIYNGHLYFLVDNRILAVSVGTPNFNDFGEWRINEFKLSPEKYCPEDNSIDLKPYNFESIFINSDDLEMLDLSSKEEKSDDEREYFIKKFGNFEYELCGGVFEGEKEMNFFINNTEINFIDWKKSENKTSFEKIFFPILNGFRLGYINSRKEEKNTDFSIYI